MGIAKRLGLSKVDLRIPSFDSFKRLLRKALEERKGANHDTRGCHAVSHVPIISWRASSCGSPGISHLSLILGLTALYLSAGAGNV